MVGRPPRGLPFLYPTGVLVYSVPMVPLVLAFFFLLPTINIEKTMEQVTAIRGLPFKSTVEFKVIERSELDAYIDDAIKDTYGDNVPQVEAWLKALHLVPQELDLSASLVELYKSQIAAFYNPKDHTYYAIKGIGDEGMVAEMVALHELTHALQDQYLDLYKRMNGLKDNHDAQLALQQVQVALLHPC